MLLFIGVCNLAKKLPYVRRIDMNGFTYRPICRYFGISCHFLFLSMNVKATRLTKELWFVQSKVKSRYFVVTEQPLFTSFGRFLAARMESFLLPTRFLHSRSQSFDPFGQRRQKDRSSGNENENPSIGSELGYNNSVELCHSSTLGGFWYF